MSSLVLESDQYAMTCMEIAEEMGVSHQTVLNIQNKAFEKIRKANPDLVDHLIESQEEKQGFGA